ncbi:MAG: hypothetical protein IPI03_23695 [Rubrivivax sp.]|nr:hypothetical protein [Rubrivivax sp.]
MARIRFDQVSVDFLTADGSMRVVDGVSSTSPTVSSSRSSALGLRAS